MKRPRPDPSTGNGHVLSIHIKEADWQKLRTLAEAENRPWNYIAKEAIGRGLTVLTEEEVHG